MKAVRWRVDFSNCTISDVSLEGCRVATFKRLPRNRCFALTIVLSNDYSVDAEARVSWHRIIEDCNIYGLCFTTIRESEQEKIHRFIRGVPAEGLSRQHPVSSPRKTSKEGGGVMEEVNFADRRIFERFSVKMPVRYLSMDPGTEGEAQACNVSAKGVGLVAKKALPLRTAVELWMQIPDKGEPLYARGEVVWAMPQAEGGHRLGISLEKADLMGMSRVLRTI